MAKSVFLNVLSPALKDGTISIQFTQANTDALQPTIPPVWIEPQSFTIKINLAKGKSERALAADIKKGLALGWIANNAAYVGKPTFYSDLQIPFTFMGLQTDHIISIWSQCDYSAEIIDNESQARILLTSAPIFCTLSQAKEFADISGVRLVNASNVAMNDHTIVSAIKTASSKLVAMLNGFNVIPCNYLQLESGEWFRGVNCRYAPVIHISPVISRGPYGPGMANSLNTSTIQRVEVDEYSGYLQFLDWSNTIGINEATDFGNAILWSYIAGHEYVADALGQIAIQAVGLAKAPVEIAGFKGASFSLDFRDPRTALPLLTSALSQWAV